MHNPTKQFILVFSSSFFLLICTYLFALDAHFVLDDYNWLHPISLKELGSFFFQSWGHGSAYRPLMRVSFFIDYWLFADNPLGWHLHSYILHSVNATLLFLIVHFHHKHYLPAILTAVLFTIAPWGHDNIAWISARTYSLSAVFYLAALYLVLLYITTSKKVLLFLSSLLLLMALMTYEASVSFAPVLGVLLLFSRKNLQLPYKRLLYLMLYFGLLTSIFLVFRSYVLQGLGALNQNHVNYFEGLYFNLKIIIRIFFYDYPFISVCVLTVATLFLTLQWHYKRLQETAYVGAILLLLILLVYLPFSQVNGVAYRFLYLTQAPYIYAISYSLYRLLQFEKRVLKHAFFSNTLLLTLVVGTASASVKIAQEWQVAGRWSKNIPMQVKQLYPKIPEGFNLVFQNIPDGYNRAGVFLTYFEFVIKHQYPLFKHKIFRAKHLLKAKDFKQARPELPAKYFIFYGENMVELSQVQWEMFNGFRQYSLNKENFDSDLYLRFYPDVSRHATLTQQAHYGWTHWVEHGKNENRIALPK